VSAGCISDLNKLGGWGDCPSLLVFCATIKQAAPEKRMHTASVLRLTIALLTPRTVDQIYFGQSPRIRQALGFKSDPDKRAGSVQFDRREAWPNVKRCSNPVTFVPGRSCTNVRCVANTCALRPSTSPSDMVGSLRAWSRSLYNLETRPTECRDFFALGSHSCAPKCSCGTKETWLRFTSARTILPLGVANRFFNRSRHLQLLP
jgi:hypothetical protein